MAKRPKTLHPSEVQRLYRGSLNPKETFYATSFGGGLKRESDFFCRGSSAKKPRRRNNQSAIGRSSGRLADDMHGAGAMTLFSKSRERSLPGARAAARRSGGGPSCFGHPRLWVGSHREIRFPCVRGAASLGHPLLWCSLPRESQIPTGARGPRGAAGRPNWAERSVRSGGARGGPRAVIV